MLVILWGCTVKLLTMITVKLVIILDLLCTGFYLEHPNLLPSSIFTQRPINDQKIEASSQCCTDYIEPNNQGWQGRAGSLTSAPRPATPVETSAQRPATPSDLGLVRDSPGILRATPQGDAHPTPGRPEA